MFRSLLLAFVVFAGVAPLLVILWAMLLGPVMEPVWPALGDAAEPVGVTLMGFAVLSSVAVYGALLWRQLRKTLGPQQARVHLVAAGLAPLLLTALALGLVVSQLRFGF